MRKLLLILAMLAMGKAFAAPVPVETAQTVALNFFRTNAGNNIPANLNAVLKYTRTEADGTPDFYVFDISPAKGFVIVSAEDITQPVIGYSTESNFVTDISANIGLSDWMINSSAKINNLKRQTIVADENITEQWTTYKTGASPRQYRGTTVAPLLSITWNQEPYYNQLCPFNTTDNERCVTGCVATAMAQIMKFWNYPAHGTGSHSYTASGYGTQSANFSTTTYNWASMPASLNANNTDIATLMYQCGVAVNMAYGDDKQGGSGAAVLGGNPSAQYAYANYFSYNASTLKGVNQSSYTATAWVALLQGELNAGRPVQYMGFETSGGGHTWVCDGYDINNNFHMNWGWGGYDNGYFSLTNLNPNPYVFNSNDAALIGIQPASAPSCSVPSGLSTTSITSSSANFNWTAVTGAASYNVQFRKVGTTTWTSGTSTTNSFLAPALLSSTNYEWQVQTVCSASSTSAFTASSTFITLAAATCSVPTGLSTTTITNNSAKFNWTTVAGAAGYNVQYRKAGTTTWTSGTTSANSFSASSLLSSTNYEWQVQTVCSASSTSAFTASSTFTALAATTCSAPVSLSTTSVTSSSATLNWTAVAGVAGYNIQFRKVGTTTWTSGTTSANSFSVPSLSSSTNYEWQVQTVCSAGSTSAFTASSTFTTLTATITCNTPAGLSAGSIANTTATLSWTTTGANSYNL